MTVIGLPEKSMRHALALGLILLALLTAPRLALAHPHSWIDLRSEVLTDAQGRVTGLKQYWLFDPLYTSYVVADMPAGMVTDEALQALKDRNLSELAAFAFFTDARKDGERLQVSLEGAGRGGLRDDRLWMEFTLRFDQPVDPATAEFTYAIYDPTYYIEMLHLDGEPVMIGDTGTARCFGDIQPPNPSPATIALAASLDQTQSAGDGLGVLFAETVILTCQ